MSPDGDSLVYRKEVGRRIRDIRRQRKLSLQDVEGESKQEFKASVLGAYERGERAISVPRLQRLARFYGVPVDQLLPVVEEPPTPAAVEESVTIDLAQLDSRDDMKTMDRYLRSIRLQRQDFNGKVVTVRRDDVRALARVLGDSAGRVGDYLDELGLRPPK
ncbi:MAG: helix-turn-helix domain-containing protein [Actinobacteria bacterium]|nr:MAG: helix-turn-helix domain-containing protein [Actinomycetota bacterium]